MIKKFATQQRRDTKHKARDLLKTAQFELTYTLLSKKSDFIHHKACSLCEKFNTSNVSFIKRNLIACKLERYRMIGRKKIRIHFSYVYYVIRRNSLSERKKKHYFDFQIAASRRAHVI